jgi:protein phosphatase 2C family protein 2/3
MHTKCIMNPRFSNFQDASSVLVEAFRACEEEWNVVATEEEEYSGSCAIACLVRGNQIVLAHAGDCRAVARLGKRTVQLTKDHRPSDPAEKARIYAAGGIIKGGRVMGVLAPSRGFGDLDVKRKAPSPVRSLAHPHRASPPPELTLVLAQDVIISVPDVTSFTMDEFVKGLPSFVILATDGIWDAMSGEKACDIVSKSLAKHNDEEAAARKLCQVAAELNSDDCSAVVVLFPSG